MKREETLKLLLMCMSVFSTYVCTVCMPGACRDQKGVSDPLELELWVFVNHRVGAWNGTRSSARATGAL